MEKWLLLLIVAVGTTSAFFFHEPFQRPAFDPFWRNFENNMKRLEETFKQADKTDEVVDSEFGASEAADMTHAGGDITMETNFGGLPDIFGFNFAQPWWKGKNVCVSREELDESTSTDTPDLFTSYQLSSCKQTSDRYVCTTKFQNHGVRKTFTVKYECCHGYQLQSAESQCVQVDLRLMNETIKDEGANEFSKMLESNGIWERLNSDEGNYTLFAVADGNFILGDLADAMQETNQLEPLLRRRRESELIEVTEISKDPRTGRGEWVESNASLNKILLNHILKGVHRVADFRDKESLETLGGSVLKVNVYPGPVTTVNCARITKANKLSENGVVHMIDRVLKPATSNIADLLANDPRFNIFKSLLKKSTLIDDLSNMDNEYTVFAPTDDAFNKLPKELYDMYVSSGECVDEVLSHHVLRRTLCLSAMDNDSWFVTPMSGERLQLRKNDASDVTINDEVNVGQKDLVASNGVVHVVDLVLVPDSGKRLSDVLSNRNLSTFNTLLLESDLLSKSYKNITWFVPREKSLDDPEIRSLLSDIREDKDKLRDLLLYHSIEPQLDLKTVKSGDSFITQASNNMKLDLDVSYSNPMFLFSQPMATVQCARVKISPSRACGVNIHELDRLLIPPTKSIPQYLSDNAQFSILSQILKKSGLEEDLSTQQPLTLLAPTNDAFNDLSARVLNSMLENEDEAKKLILRHTMPESRCCHGISSNPFLWTTSVTMKDNSEVQARRDHMGHVHFGRARALKCDYIATNGIVHTLNRVLMPKKVESPFSGMFLDTSSPVFQSKNPNTEVLLFGI